MKWGEALSAGFQVIPNILIRDQNRLGLDALDVVILLNLTSHWWEQDNKPFVSPSLIGKRMNVSTLTVERPFEKLEDRQFIGRDPRGPMGGDGPYIRRYDLIAAGRNLEGSEPKRAHGASAPRERKRLIDFEPRRASRQRNCRPPGLKQ